MRRIAVHGTGKHFTGGCRCGEVRYAISSRPPVYCCHCRDCQTWSTSAFSQNAVVREEAFRVTAGVPVAFRLTNPSGSISHQFACGACHTRLFNRNSVRPGLVIVRAGTFDRSDEIEPALHIWTKRKQPWIVLDDSVPAFAEGAPADLFLEIASGEQP